MWTLYPAVSVAGATEILGIFTCLPAQAAWPNLEARMDGHPYPTKPAFYYSLLLPISSHLLVMGRKLKNYLVAETVIIVITKKEKS